ncbi:MAG: L,D-transpeptidase family protein [Patescibacteria group bacterium]|nr:L,D-transpeptidase family protein [Patescibacteria group bacterium]MDD5554988.1 L,D-transpeptidase family protein [Patescibacteria group bacterium]
MKYFIIIFCILFFSSPVLASGLPDFDGDGVLDKDEIEIYGTNQKIADTDGDGFNDWVELNTGYSPLNPQRVKLEDSDYDGDGLSDRMELNFHTDLTNPDTDGDGYKDGEEINGGFNPLAGDGAKLEKRIEVNTGEQVLSYWLGGVRLGSFPVSTGKASMPTPKGRFTIYNKVPKAWSGAYGLWMPYWLGMQFGKFGIHELPVWPNGYKEGENHLGTPVSHGCIRLGVGPAKLIYDWTPVGTPVFIY